MGDLDLKDLLVQNLGGFIQVLFLFFLHFRFSKVYDFNMISIFFLFESLDFGLFFCYLFICIEFF